MSLSTSQINCLLIEITDHGRGLQPDANTAGSGITGLSDRVEALGGNLELNSAIGTGTTLRAVLPARPSVTADH